MFGLSQTLTYSLTQTQSLFLGETLGEIPLYSLHRIKRLMQKKGIPPLNIEIQQELVRALIRQNRVYQTKSRNDWNCITSENLLAVFEDVKMTLTTAIKSLDLQFIKLPEETHSALLRRLIGQRNAIMTVIEKWFSGNFDSLMYDTNGNIPWTIVQRLRASLNIWITTRTNVFGADIEDAILDVAQENGIITNDPEDAWIKMGGKLFTKK